MLFILCHPFIYIWIIDFKFKFKIKKQRNDSLFEIVTIINRYHR